MKYKLINYLPKLTKDGKEMQVHSIFDDFESVANKIIRDLNSIWKGNVCLPLKFEIQEVLNDEKGFKIIVDGKVTERSDEPFNGALELYGYVQNATEEALKDIVEDKVKIYRKSDFE